MKTKATWVEVVVAIGGVLIMLLIMWVTVGAPLATVIHQLVGRL